MKALDLKAQLNSQVKNFYFVTGEDDYLKNLAISAFCSYGDADFKDFNLAKFDGLLEPSRFLTECETAPLMEEHRFIILQNVKKADTFMIGKYQDVLEKPVSGAVVVFVALDDSLKSLYKYGEIVDCGKLDARSVNGLIVEAVKEKGYTIEQSAVIKLSTLTLFNMTRISGELEKLFAYCIDVKRISEADVIQLVSPETDLKIYELSSKIAEGRNREAVEILNNLGLQGEKSSAILASLTAQYRRVLHVALSDMSDIELSKCLDVKPYSITSARGLARGYTQTALKNIIDKLVGLEYGFKSGNFSEDDALNFAVAFLIKG